MYIGLYICIYDKSPHTRQGTDTSCTQEAVTHRSRHSSTYGHTEGGSGGFARRSYCWRSIYIYTSIPYIYIQTHAAERTPLTPPKQNTRPRGCKTAEGTPRSSEPGLALGHRGRDPGCVSPLNTLPLHQPPRFLTPSPTGHCGNPRGAPPAAADGRWQQTAGNGRAPQRGGGTGGTARRGAASLFLHRVLFPSMKAQGNCQRKERRGFPPPPLPPPTPPSPRGTRGPRVETRCQPRGERSHKWLPAEGVEGSV